ncbi:MAG TPA: glycosyltransferase family 9 protein [Burkholderiaceae bacterium]|nr:glycosyltransferase family 9 protein [Burkholderiaceae bacterium]
MPSIFVRLPNHLGDACMSVPALDLLAANGFSPTLVGRAWARDLFAAYPWPTLALAGDLRERAATLRAALSAAGPAAKALLLTNSFSSALDFALARRRAAGYATDGRRWLLRPAFEVPLRWAAGMHMVEYYFTLATSVVGMSAEVPQQLDLKVHPEKRIRARGLLDAAGVGGAYVVLCPVAVGLHRGRVKAWDGFGRLCDELRARGQTVVACPGPGEQQAVGAVLKDARILPPTDVGTFAALLAASRLVVANDSGPGHVAAAVGARLVSVFGVTEPTRTRPWGPAVTLVGSERGWPRYEEVAGAVAAALASG